MLKDIAVYKNRLLSLFLDSNDIAELFLGKEYNKETADEELMYKYVFPYLHADETQTEVKSYICMEVDVPKTLNASYKDMQIIIWCYSHRDDMKCSTENCVGTTPDILTDIIDTLLSGSRNFGMGRLMLESAAHITPTKEHYGRQLIYTCPEFR